MNEPLAVPGTRNEGCSRGALQRLRCGELAGDEAARVRAHAAACERCGRELAGLEREAEQLHAELPFETFAVRVEAKQRLQRRRSWAGPVSLALAAGIAGLVVAGPLYSRLEGRRNEIKGARATLELRAGGNGNPSRVLVQGDALRPGERVMVGYEATKGVNFVLVLSVDQQGVVTPLFPEKGRSLPAETGRRFMPDSLELTGTGVERIIGVFSERPVDVDVAADAARREFSRAGGVSTMGELPIDGTSQSAANLRKP